MPRVKYLKVNKTPQIIDTKNANHEYIIPFLHLESKHKMIALIQSYIAAKSLS